MSSSSTVTYTSVYTDSEPGRVFWGADEDLSDGCSPQVIIYGYDGLLMQPVAPPSPDYMQGPEHPPSLDYVPGPEHPPLPVEVPYIPEPEYPEYLVPSDPEAPLEDQPLPADALPTALSPGYMVDFDLEEDPEEDHADYPMDGRDGDDEPSDDDDDDIDDEDEEPFEDKDDDEEEHLALTDSSAIPVVDLVSSAEDTEAFETDKAAPTPVPSPRRHTARMSVRPQTPILLPSEVENKVGKSSTAAPRPTGGHRADYGFIGTMDAEIRSQRVEEVGYGIRDVWVDPTEAVEEVAPTTLEGVNARVTELAAFHYKTTRLLDQEALVSQEAWAHSVGLSSTVHYELQAYRTHTQIQDYHIASQKSLTATLIAQVSLLQGQLSVALGQIQALQTRDQTHANDPKGAGSSA
ncbi:hypothetical protein Tco_0647956 [Tanacetum coccineum]